VGLDEIGVERQRGAEFLLCLRGAEVIEQFDAALKPGDGLR
jgi:hypothetical protein